MCLTRVFIVISNTHGTHTKKNLSFIIMMWSQIELAICSCKSHEITVSSCSETKLELMSGCMNLHDTKSVCQIGNTIMYRVYRVVDQKSAILTARVQNEYYPFNLNIPIHTHAPWLMRHIKICMAIIYNAPVIPCVFHHLYYHRNKIQISMIWWLIIIL